MMIEIVWFYIYDRPGLSWSIGRVRRAHQWISVPTSLVRTAHPTQIICFTAANLL